MAPNLVEREYLFLMRHAEHREGHLTPGGAAHVHALANRFEEWISAAWRRETDRRIRVWHASSASEVRETADLLTRNLAAALRHRGAGTASRISEHPVPSVLSGHRMAAPLPRAAATADRDPERELTAYSPDADAFQKLCQWLDSGKSGDSQARRQASEAPLVVGNDPLIGWLAAALTGRPTPVARGELVCLTRSSRRRRRSRWRLSWTISDDGEAEAEAIRTKIKSKMTTATALGTVIVGLTTFLLQNALHTRPSMLQWLAFAALGSSAALYFISLFLYDGLQMPPRFWASRFAPPTPDRGTLRHGRAAIARLRHGTTSVHRPPSSTARLLHAGMLRIWLWIFTPATLLAGLGVVLYALSATSPGRTPADTEWWQVLTTVVTLAILIAAWVVWNRPDLGSSD